MSSTCRCCWRATTAWITATTGLTASCGARACAMTAGLSLIRELEQPSGDKDEPLYVHCRSARKLHKRISADLTTRWHASRRRGILRAGAPSLSRRYTTETRMMADLALDSTRVRGHCPQHRLRHCALDQAILQVERRALLALATGTGKTVIAIQICYKLGSPRWNRSGDLRRPCVLFLAYRNVLLDVPKDQTFTSFGDYAGKVEGEAVKSREMYFATYQAIARDEHRPAVWHLVSSAHPSG